MHLCAVLAPLLALSPFWGELDPGPHGVGFERILAFDHSRPFGSDSAVRARPISISIWYPAVASDEGAPVPFARYLEEVDGRERFEERLVSLRLALTSEEMDRILASPTAAFESAPRQKGPFPLLLFGTALTGPSYLSTVLAEYLASHGYVAVALPSLPARSDVEPDHDLRAVDAQMRDMEFAIQELHDYPEVSLDRMGLVAWSLGGVSQALLQMKNPDVAAVVSLDGATGYAYGQRLLERSMFFEPARATAAFLHATDSRESGPVPKSLRYYDEIVRGPSFLLTIPGAAHVDFTSLALLPGSVLESRASPDARTRYRLLCLYVRRFLDLSLKGDAAAKEFLDVAPTRHGFEGLVLSRKR